MRVALTFSILSFFGGWAYSEALSLAEPSVVNIISATSGIFVCVLAALFPSNSSDHFTFSKLAASFLSAVGVVLVTMSSSSHSSNPTNSTTLTHSSILNPNQSVNRSRGASGSYYVVLPTILDTNEQHLTSAVGPVKNTWKSPFQSLDKSLNSLQGNWEGFQQ